MSSEPSLAQHMIGDFAPKLVELTDEVLFGDIWARPELSPRDPEDGVLQSCRELDVGFVPYSPLGRGFLSGEIKTPGDLEAGDMRLNHPRFQGENFQKNLDLVAEIKKIAGEKSITPSQLALAWVLAQGQDIVPIPGTKRVKYLEENLAALNVILTPDNLKRIDAAFPPGLAQGTRQPVSGMSFLNG